VLPPPDLDLAAITRRLAPSLPWAHAPADGSRAAVAAILRPGAEGAEVLLIQRAEREGDPWSGHMAFPGGRRASADRDLCATAVRETREEIGVDLDANAVLLGRLVDEEAYAKARRTGLVIAPFVFSLQREVDFAFDPREVAEALWAPLAPLARGEGARTLRYEHDGVALDLPCWDVQGRVVWGLTHRMLSSLFEALATR
jgi:8-oxo-dGTP pyrophosphatase MutT (NUDIX family)